MGVFLTGATGYLGSYIANELYHNSDERLILLVRAKSPAEAEKRLWKSMQLHLSFERFIDFVRGRVEIVLGDLTAPTLGLDADARKRLIQQMSSVIHCAASLNRKSAKACFNVNLRGTLEIIKLARAAQDQHGLRRFSDVSTVAVAGQRQGEVVDEAHTIDWSRSDYDPYARTKKFCEHMVHELLPDVPITIFRPSIVLGDSRFPETTQFDMVRAFTMLAQLPVLPFDGAWRADIVPANYVGRAVAQIHQLDKPRYGAYNLSSGTDSLTYRQITDALRGAGHKRKHVYLPALAGGFGRLIDALASTPRDWGVALPASLMKVFLPYLMFDTVFDNSRVVEELGEKPRPFDEYCYTLLRFAADGGFRYPYKPWPEDHAALTDAHRKAS